MGGASPAQRHPIVRAATMAAQASAWSPQEKALCTKV
jgi:hypothetical protein